MARKGYVHNSVGFLLAFFCCLLLQAVGLLGLPTAACSQQRDQYADNRKKVALTIGISRYEKANPLVNPVRDVAAVAARLKQLGFETSQIENLSSRAAGEVIDHFLSAAERSDIALLYYSGHGLQINGENYIVPADFDPAEGNILNQLLPISRVLDGLEKRAKVKIILLDACRNNPFISVLQKNDSLKLVSKGLVPINVHAPAEQPGSSAYGLIVGYATQPNDTADDGSGSLSPYAASLLQATVPPDEDFNLSLVKAARLVVTETNGGQRPEHRVALTQPLFLVSRRKPLNCDLLAAETDNNISVKGVEFDKIDTSAAIPACRADLAKERDNPRLIHNLARSLDKAGKKQEAARLYRRAAELGFDWSQNNLSVMYMSGDGIDPDFGKAMFWLRKAFAQGNRQAIVNYTSTDMSELFSEDRERTLQLQRALKRLGLYHAAESGLFDNATKEALSAFKTGKDIRNEGITFQVMDALEITKLVLRRQ